MSGFHNPALRRVNANIYHTVELVGWQVILMSFQSIIHGIFRLLNVIYAHGSVSITVQAQVENALRSLPLPENGRCALALHIQRFFLRIQRSRVEYPKICFRHAPVLEHRKIDSSTVSSVTSQIAYLICARIHSLVFLNYSVRNCPMPQGITL